MVLSNQQKAQIFAEIFFDEKPDNYFDYMIKIENRLGRDYSRSSAVLIYFTLKAYDVLVSDKQIDSAP